MTEAKFFLLSGHWYFVPFFLPLLPLGRCLGYPSNWGKLCELLLVRDLGYPSTGGSCVHRQKELTFTLCPETQSQVDVSCLILRSPRRRGGGWGTVAHSQRHWFPFCCYLHAGDAWDLLGTFFIPAWVQDLEQCQELRNIWSMK